MFHGAEQLGDLILRLTHAGAHLVGGAGALLGELAHLVGHDAEAQPVRAGTRRLDRRVQGEQIGLARDARDRVHQLADLARAQLERSGRPRHLIEVIHQRHEQLARPGDLLTVTARLLRHTGDLALRVLGAGVQLRGHSGGRLGVGPAVPDQLALPLGAAREALRGRRDPLRCGLHLASRRRQLFPQGGELPTLALHLSHDGGDPVGGPVQAHAEVPELVGSVVRYPHGQVARFEPGERGAGGAQPREEARQHRHQRRARDEQHQGLLEKRAPRPAGCALTGADTGDERERRQVDDQRLPGLVPAEVERGLERGDQIRHVQEMPRRADGVDDRGDHGGAHRHGGERVPRGQRA